MKMASGISFSAKIRFMSLIIKYQAETGKVVTFVPKEFKPLSFRDFIDAHTAKSNLYKINVNASEIEIQEANGGRKFEKYGQIKMPINFHRSLPVYALVGGGWLPPPFVQPPHFLPDRNVIGYIEQITKANPRSLYADADWWLRMIGDKEMLINPFLYAFESNRQMIPELEDFKKSYQDAVQIVRLMLPTAKIVIYEELHFQAAYETMADILANHQREMKFLLATAPLIRESVARNELQKIMNEIFRIAADLGLQFKSLPLLAVLSCLFEDQRISGFNAGRELLKLRGGDYTEEKAYNTLSDMRGIMFYLAFRAIAEKINVPPLAYCTADKAALLFGCGLDFKNIEFRGNQLYLTISLNDYLFPRLPDDEKIVLVKRIEREA